MNPAFKTIKTNSKFRSLIEFPIKNKMFVKTAAECCHVLKIHRHIWNANSTILRLKKSFAITLDENFVLTNSQVDYQIKYETKKVL